MTLDLDGSFYQGFVSLSERYTATTVRALKEQWSASKA
jgi:hypothetical protein